MVLKLIAEAAGNKESAGPYIIADGVRQPIRDWLCDALMPLAERNPHRRNITNRIRTELEAQSLLPSDQDEAAAVIDNAVRAHVLRSAKCNVSTAVSDLVRAGLVRRHYQGYRVDHHNRGAQREAVYTLTKEARSMLSRSGWPH